MYRLLLLLMPYCLRAQTTTTSLTGTVRDNAGQPLPDVNVFLKATFAARHNVSVVGKYWVDKLHTLLGALTATAAPAPTSTPIAKTSARVPTIMPGAYPAFRA